MILEHPELFVGTIAEKMLTFALGRGIEPADGPTFRQIVRRAKEQDYRMHAIVHAVVESPAFQWRTTR